MIVTTMIPAYMGEVKSDGSNHLYFSYPTPVATNMVPANFTAYSMPIPPPYEAVVNIAKQQDENFPITISAPSTSSSAVTSASTSIPQPPQQQQEEQEEQQQQRLQQRRSIVPVDEEARKK
uniref:Pv-fam-g protein n=1 Tax=Elaeophora elaphi TaxID=1147741 RepID=A0A0R3RNG9_9BILA